jgi:hypothetical protein
LDGPVVLFEEHLHSEETFVVVSDGVFELLLLSVDVSILLLYVWHPQLVLRGCSLILLHHLHLVLCSQDLLLVVFLWGRLLEIDIVLSGLLSLFC